MSDRKEYMRNYGRKWRLKNRKRLLNYKQNWRKEQSLKYPNAVRKYEAEYKIKNPMQVLLNSIRSRCNNYRATSYPWYGAKGIKCFLTVGDLKFLWERDNGHKLNRPSIDRINSNKNYTLSNCRFIELSDNVRIGNINRVLDKSTIV